MDEYYSDIWDDFLFWEEYNRYLMSDFPDVSEHEWGSEGDKNVQPEQSDTTEE